MSIQGKIKTILEATSGHRAWLEPSADLNDVRELLKKLRPVTPEKPFVRIGGTDDGGYVSPDDLDGITACLSPGVFNEISFDLDMASRGIEVYMADASVDGPPEHNDRFHFYKKFLDVFEDDGNMRMDSLAAEIPDSDSGDLILQMDIEGAEYRVLLDASDELLQKTRIMVIEFHHLDRLYAKFPFQMIKATFEKLLRTHHVVHIHPNNVCGARKREDIEIPPVMEFTFYRKDLSPVKYDANRAYPHALDKKNLSHLPDVVLPKSWR